MGKIPAAVPTLDTLIEAEAQNFHVTTRTLGTTVELVSDFQELYQSLADFIKISGRRITPEYAQIAVCVLHLLMKCRSDLLIGSLNILRGYQGNSLRFLRAAIEACAFAARIRKHPHLVD